MPRLRGKTRRNWPQNLYVTQRGKKQYYRWRHPVTKKEFGMGGDFDMAVEAAVQLNAEYGLTATAARLVERVKGGQLFAELIDGYMAEQESKGLASATLKTERWQCKVIREAFGDRIAKSIKVAELIAWLDDKQPRVRSLHRTRLVAIYNWALVRELVDRNIAQAIPTRAVKIKRGRLLESQFWAILPHAKRYVQTAMLLALVTGQRREDVANMQFSDIKDGILTWRQSKTKTTGGMRVEGLLADIIHAARTDGCVSKYIVHHQAGRGIANAPPGSKVFPDAISKGFQRARDKSGLFDDTPKEERPTFHEIRSLSARLYKERGGDPQAVLGHLERRTTDKYLDNRGAEIVAITPLIERISGQ